MKVDLKIPHFTTVADRAKSLGKYFQKLSRTLPTDLVFDSSGFKIYGEGEWTVRQHGKQKRRHWRKFHLGVCPKTHEIIIAEVTELETADCEVGPKIIRKAPRSVKRAIGDGAYDTWSCYEAAFEKGQQLITPPKQGAMYSKGEEPWRKDRNNAICEIIGLGNSEEAMRLWKNW